VADPVDRAQGFLESFEERAVAARRLRPRPAPGSRGASPAAACADCGEEIAPARRDAAPGARRCAFCQGIVEGAR
jgi:phage/conjugal plasmid C-4 type zinc finger TraR family protein